MKTKLIILGCLTACAVAFAYLPVNWNNRHANADFRKADAVIIGRITKITRQKDEVKTKEGSTQYCFTYVASVTAGRVFRGNIKTNEILRIPIGGYWQDKVDETQPTWIMQRNTQSGYDLRINRIYLLALSKYQSETTGEYWEPRSGHHSIHPIELSGNEKKILFQSGRNRYSWEVPYLKHFHSHSTNLESFVTNYILSTNNLYPNKNWWEETRTNTSGKTIDI